MEPFRINPLLATRFASRYYKPILANVGHASAEGADLLDVR